MTSYRLRWNDGGYERFGIYVRKVAGDGSCLVHSICYSYYIPYRTCVLDNKKITRREIVKNFRENLALELEKIDPFTGISIYNSLHEGNIALASEDVPEYRLSSLQQVLRSNAQLSHTIISIIETVYNITIFVLDHVEKDIYVTDNYRSTDSAIVLYHTPGHFDAISVRDSNSDIYSTHFDSNHPFILFLRNRIASKKRSP